MSTLPAVRFGRVEIVAAERRLLVDGAAVALGSRAFDLLAALVQRRDRVVPKDELIELVWPGLIVEDNNLQVQISALRKALGAQAIATVPGRGYQFTVAETASAATAQPVDVAPSPRPLAPPRTGDSTRPSRLLVADDNRVNRLLLCRSLELMGHVVTSVDNGRDALERLSREPFDLLLLDLEMPELDGFGVLERRAGDANLGAVPVIVTSSVEGAAKVARCLELGADDFLHKPVDPLLLKARVASSLERKHLRDRQRDLIARLAPGLDDMHAPDGGAARTLDATLLTARLHDLDDVATASPEDLLETLSHWSTLMLDGVEGRGGLVTQLAGDRLVALFGLSGAAPAADAAQAALEMHEMLALFNAERAAAGKPALRLAVGLASGTVVAGPVRAPRRAAYACVGAAVQRSAALADDARATAPIQADAATRAALPASIQIA